MEPFEKTIATTMSYDSSGIFGLAFIAFLIITLSSTARFYTKMIVFILGSMLLSTFLPIPFFIIRPRDWRNALGPAWGCRILGRLLGVFFEVRGLENINRDQGGVVLINHQSGLDLIVLAHLWPIIGRPMVVAKKEILYLFPFGTASYLWGTLFINRADHQASMHKLNKESQAITEQGSKILFFPEGTRNQQDQLLPFKKGPFHIAIQSQSVLQPVVVSKYTYLDSKNKSFGRGKSCIHILPEINCKGLTTDDLPKLLDDTQKLMQKHFESLSKEVLAINSLKKIS